MADRSNVYALIGVIVIIGVLTFVFTRDLSTSGQAVASDVEVNVMNFNSVFLKTGLGDSLPASTAIKMTVYLRDEQDKKEFFIEQGGVSEYSGEEYELGLEIWRGTFSSLYRSNDLCAFKENIFRIEQKSTFKLIKYVAVRNLCG